MPRSRSADELPTEAASGSQTIMRALGVLEALRDAHSAVGVTELARAVELPVSTVHRILRTLVLAGYVVQNVETDRYRLGRQAFLLGRAASHTLGFDAAQPLLERLAEETGESVNLVVRDRNEGLVVLRVESPQPLRFAQPAGTRIPLHSTSSGKVLLAFAADPVRELTELGELERHTRSTTTSLRKLTDELRDIRQRGYSINKGERIAGVYGVAAPVLDTDGTAIAALAIQGPETRMSDRRISDLAPMVMRTAAQIVSALPSGYHI